MTDCPSASLSSKRLSVQRFARRQLTSCVCQIFLEKLPWRRRSPRSSGGDTGGNQQESAVAGVLASKRRHSGLRNQRCRMYDAGAEVKETSRTGDPSRVALLRN